MRGKKPVIRRSVRWWICLRLRVVSRSLLYICRVCSVTAGTKSRALVAKNIYDKDCEMMLAAFCVQYARFLTADEKVKERGLIILNKEGGGMHNPYVGISNSAYDRAVRLASEFRLTPVSRKRVVKAHRSVARTGAMKFLKPV